MKTILAIDPGPKRSALSLWDGQRTHALILDNDLVKPWLREWRHAIQEVYCEEIASYGMAVGADVFQTCFWSGRFWEMCDVLALPFYFKKRAEVKMHLCRSMQAKDSNIIQALKDRFGDKGTKNKPGFFFGFKEDMWQAFALAVTAHDKLIGTP